jgi:hypothetical protein
MLSIFTRCSTIFRSFESRFINTVSPVVSSLPKIPNESVSETTSYIGFISPPFIKKFLPQSQIYIQYFTVFGYAFQILLAVKTAKLFSVYLYDINILAIFGAFFAV